MDTLSPTKHPFKPVDRADTKMLNLIPSNHPEWSQARPSWPQENQLGTAKRALNN